MKTTSDLISMTHMAIAPRIRAFLALISLTTLPVFSACDARFVTDAAESPATPGTFHPITYGKPSESGYQDATLLLAYRGSATCTATLITDTIAVTAAHCVYVKDCEYNFETESLENCQLETNPSNFALFAGKTVSNAMEGRIVQAIYAHDGYDDTYLVNDITLLKFDKPFTNIDPIPVLPERGKLALNSKDVGMPLTYVGYGIDENERTPNQRMTVDGTLDALCNGNRYCTFPNIDASIGSDDLYAPPRTFCSYMNHGGTCSGDSGGPTYVVKENITYVAGVTSFGDKNCAIYGCNTDVSAFGTWIFDQLEDAGFADLKQGEFCASDSQCTSGFCSEGVCCDERCDDTLCQSCRASRGASANGTCTPIVVCDDETDCTEQGKCDPKTGKCIVANKSPATICDDSNACTLDDHCFEGACTGSGSVWCPPPNECQTQRTDGKTCNPEDGACLYDNLPDSTICTSGTCTNGICVATKNESSSGCGVISHSPAANLGVILPFLTLFGLTGRRPKKSKKNNNF